VKKHGLCGFFINKCKKNLTAKIILKLSVCVFLNYSIIWLLTPTLSIKIYLSLHENMTSSTKPDVHDIAMPPQEYGATATGIVKSYGNFEDPVLI